MIIHVTQEHIDRANDPGVLDTRCPVEWALVDAGFLNPTVTDDGVIFPHRGSTNTAHPAGVAPFVWDHDHGLPVTPFDFELPDRLVTE